MENSETTTHTLYIWMELVFRHSLQSVCQQMHVMCVFVSVCTFLPWCSMAELQKVAFDVEDFGSVSSTWNTVGLLKWLRCPQYRFVLHQFIDVLLAYGKAQPVIRISFFFFQLCPGWLYMWPCSPFPHRITWSKKLERWSFSKNRVFYYELWAYFPLVL